MVGNTPKCSFEQFGARQTRQSGPAVPSESIDANDIGNKLKTIGWFFGATPRSPKAEYWGCPPNRIDLDGSIQTPCEL